MAEDDASYEPPHDHDRIAPEGDLILLIGPGKAKLQVDSVITGNSNGAMKGNSERRECGQRY